MKLIELIEINSIRNELTQLKICTTSFQTSSDEIATNSILIGTTGHQDDYKYQIRIYGIVEPEDAKGIDRSKSDLLSVKNILDHLQVSNTIICNCYRLGKFKTGSMRP